MRSRASLFFRGTKAFSGLRSVPPAAVLPPAFLLMTFLLMAASWGAAPALAAEETPQEKMAKLEAKVQANPTDAKSWNDLGVLRAQEGNLNQARDAFIHAVQADPSVGDFHRNLGLAFSKLGDYELAVSEFQAYRRFDTMGGKDFWRLIGGAQMQAGMTEDARVTFQEGLDVFGENPGPEGLRLALALNKLESDAGNEEAVRQLLEKYTKPAVQLMRFAKEETDEGYQEARQIVNNRVVLMVENAKLLEQSDLLTEAGDLYAEAYKLTPQRDDLLPRLVDVYLKNDQSMEARVAARLARDDHPDKAGTWVATAKVYEQTLRLPDAIKAYKKAYDIDPDFPDLRVVIGNLLMREGRDAEARQYLKDGVSISSTKPEVVYNYAVSLMRDKKFHAAIPSLRTVVEELPEFFQGRLALAQCLQQTRRYREAATSYEKAYDLHPDPKLLFHIARCAQKGKQPTKAIMFYEKALVEEPGYVKARYNLALTYMDAKRYDKAVDSFQKLIELEGPSYRAYYSMGLSYYYQGLYDEALETYDMALEQKETVNVLNNIGLVYDALGDKKNAQSYYKDAKALKEGN